MQKNLSTKSGEEESKDGAPYLDKKHLHLYFQKKKCYLHCQVICYVKLNIILKFFIVCKIRYEFCNFKSG